MLDVTLTFDNGPEPDVTPGVLDTLRREGIRATFFVLGHKLAADSGRLALARRARDEGHWIGNHTYTHSTPLGAMADPAASVAEIERTQAMIGDLAHPERLFRPFGGGGAIGRHLLSAEALARLKEGRFTCVLWNIVPRDWQNPETWPETALEMMRPLDWSVVVLHDLPGGAMDHLERFIAMVRDAGGRFRQDFPAECVPLRAGREISPMAPYVAERAA